MYKNNCIIIYRKIQYKSDHKIQIVSVRNNIHKIIYIKLGNKSYNNIENSFVRSVITYYITHNTKKLILRYPMFKTLVKLKTLSFLVKFSIRIFLELGIFGQFQEFYLFDL